MIRSEVLSPTARTGARAIVCLPVALRDCLLLSLVVLLSALLYAPGLGFYSDDWAVLGWLSTSSDQSLGGLIRAIDSPHVQMRPTQTMYLATLYWLFGPQPLGYHLAHAAVLALGIVPFYLVLRELGQPRLLALAVPLVYATLPHYSTARFWIVAFGHLWSIALYFVSLYADLRALRASQPRLWGWKLVSILALLGSTLTYEVTIPLFLLNLLLMWKLARNVQPRPLTRGADPSPPYGRLAVLVGPNLVALSGVILFKLATTVRLGIDADLPAYLLGILERATDLDYGAYDYGLNVKQAIAVNFWHHGLGLPRVVWRLLSEYRDVGLLVASAALALIVVGYLWRVAAASAPSSLDRGRSLRLMGWGLLVFGLGYAIFLTNYNVQFTTTGIGNRSAVAAALGVTLVFVGALGWLSSLLASGRLRRVCFCLLVGLTCLVGFLVNTTLASFWIAAYREQQAILADIRERHPALPSGTALILDGICPYVGPAIVFESSWDLRGALMTIYRDRSLRADVVTPKLEVGTTGLATSLYDSLHSHYPYGEQLLMYDSRRKLTHRLADVEAARGYFHASNSNRGGDCPPGWEGHGVPIW